MRIEWHVVDSSVVRQPLISHTRTGLSTYVSNSRSAFTAPSDSHDRPPKRLRETCDVDGESSEDAQSKKRRLRRDLVTSRLSKPYALPPTNIIGRGECKIAIWARQNASGKTLLRKAAILNSIRIKREAILESERKRLAIPLHLSWHGSSSTLQDSPQQYIPLAPSPLGLSNYDALDREEYAFGEDSDDTVEDNSSVYSDFSLASIIPVVDGYDSFDDFELWVADEPRPPLPPKEEINNFMNGCPSSPEAA